MLPADIIKSYDTGIIFLFFKFLGVPGIKLRIWVKDRGFLNFFFFLNFDIFEYSSNWKFDQDQFMWCFIYITVKAPKIAHLSLLTSVGYN